MMDLLPYNRDDDLIAAVEHEVESLWVVCQPDG